MKRASFFVCFLILALFTACVTSPVNVNKASSSENVNKVSSSENVPKTSIPTATPNTAFLEVKQNYDDAFTKSFNDFSSSFQYDERSHLYSITIVYKDVTKKAYYDNIDWADEYCDAFNRVAEIMKKAVKDKGYGDIDVLISWQADNDEGLLYSGKNGKDTYRLIDHATLRISNLSNSYSYGYYTFTGTVQNFLHRTVKFVKVKLELLDSNGRVVDTDWTYAVGVEGLNYRDSKPFEIIHKDSGVDWKKFRISVLDYD